MFMRFVKLIKQIKLPEKFIRIYDLFFSKLNTTLM